MLCNTRHWNCFLSFLLLRMARMHVDWNLKKKGKQFFSMSYLQSSIKILWLVFHDDICLISSLKLYRSGVCMGKGTFISNDLWTNLALNGNILVTSLLQIMAFSLSIFSYAIYKYQNHAQSYTRVDFFKELGAWKEKKKFLTKCLHFDLFLGYRIKPKAKKRAVIL